MCDVCFCVCVLVVKCAHTCESCRPIKIQLTLSRFIFGVLMCEREPGNTAKRAVAFILGVEVAGVRLTKTIS